MPISDRRVLTIGQLIAEGQATLQTGPFGSQLHASDYVSSGTAVIPTEAIGRRTIRDAVLPQVSKETAARLSRHALVTGDILFARRGVQATGLSAVVSKRHSGALCGTGAIRLRFASADVDPTYVSFWLSTTRSVEWIKAHAVGGVMPNVNESVLRLLPIELPSVDVQRNIAALLGSLDDKIALNSDVNAKLETLASGLYRSWFVDFDPVVAKRDGKKPIGVPAEAIDLFPSHFEDSDLGQIPQGWRVTRADEAFELNPKRELKRGQTAPYLEMAAMPEIGHAPESWVPRAAGSGMRFTDGDTLMARITPCLENGKTAFVQFLGPAVVGWGSTEYIVIRSKQPIPIITSYLLARNEDFRAFAIQGMTGSSGRQRVGADLLGRYRLAVPSDPRLWKAFGTIVEPLFEMAKVNSEESRTLAELRDTLLGPLLSGELTIKAAETVVGAAV
jgi:type I restriction enzyme S subunit